MKTWLPGLAKASEGGLAPPRLVGGAFDQGYLTLQDDGVVQVSPELPTGDGQLLELDEPLRAVRLTQGHRVYLAWHRQHVFLHGLHGRGERAG